VADGVEVRLECLENGSEVNARKGGDRWAQGRGPFFFFFKVNG
jgi:hypothetical protein